MICKHTEDQITICNKCLGQLLEQRHYDTLNEVLHLATKCNSILELEDRINKKKEIMRGLNGKHQCKTFTQNALAVCKKITQGHQSRLGFAELLADVFNGLGWDTKIKWLDDQNTKFEVKATMKQ